MVEYSNQDNGNYAGFGDFSTSTANAAGTSSLSIEQSNSDKGSNLSTFQSSVETLSGSNSSITPTKQ